MSWDVFPFAVSVRPRCAEGPSFETTETKLTGGWTDRRAELGDDFLLRAVFSLEFPQRSTGKNVAHFLEFFEAHKGRALPWLWLPITDRYREVRAAQLGLGDGVTTDFPLSRVHVKASSVVAKRNGVAAAGSDFSIVDNDTAPKIRFTAAPGVGVVLSTDFDAYYPMHFATDYLPPEIRAALPTDAARSVVANGLEIVESQPGAHLA